MTGLLITLVVLQSLSLLFNLARYGATNQILVLLKERHQHQRYTITDEEFRR